MFKKSLFSFAVVFLAFAIFLSFHIAQAHEVYVLTSQEIAQGLAAPMPDFMGTIRSHLAQFLEWGVFAGLLIMGLFFLSIAKPLEKLLDPFLLKIKHWAPSIAQVTIALALIASGWYSALFGPELPFTALFGHYIFPMQILLVALGAMLLLGIFPRLAGLGVMIVFLYSIFVYRTYMLSYLTYFGEALTVTLFGGGYTLFSFSGPETSAVFKRGIAGFLHKYKFVMLRVAFGISLLYASLYAKLIHGDLALETVTKYHLTNYFHFEPLFLVLGAMLVEILLGLFFLVGFEIRFASLFLLTFLTMSLIFFGEVVWPHVILIGTAIAMFTHGYDKYTLSAWLQNRGDLEPIF